MAMELKLRVANENKKVCDALNPPQRCPIKFYCCPPTDCRRSSIYHPDFRTENQYSCTQDRRFLPKDEALKQIRFKPTNVPLYNQPKRGQNGIKIVYTDPRCYPHRDINELHQNLSHPSCGGPANNCNGRRQQTYICLDCGCSYHNTKQLCNTSVSRCAQNNANESCSESDQKPIYFQIDSSTEDTEDCSRNCINEDQNECQPNGNHFQDCKCSLCKRRQAVACNKEEAKDNKSSRKDIWVKCDNKDCDRCHPPKKNTISAEDPNKDAMIFCVTQPNQLTTLPDPDNPNKSKEICCHHEFRLGNEPKQPQVHCVFDLNSGIVSSEQQWLASAGGFGIPYQAVQPNITNICAPKQAKKKCCNCFYCKMVKENKQSLHGPNCPCTLCLRLRCQSGKRPNYYSSLRAKQCANAKKKECSPAKTPVCYPLFGHNSSCSQTNSPCNSSEYSCQSNCLCHVMIPKDWEPHGNGCGDYENTDTDYCRNGMQLPKSARDGCCDEITPPRLVRSMTGKKSGKSCCGSISSRKCM